MGSSVKSVVGRGLNRLGSSRWRAALLIAPLVVGVVLVMIGIGGEAQSVEFTMIADIGLGIVAIWLVVVLVVASWLGRRNTDESSA